MYLNNRKTRYRFFNAGTGAAFGLEDDPKQDKTPTKDGDHDSDDDLKNVDRSKGGYGHGSGFDGKDK